MIHREAEEAIAAAKTERAEVSPLRILHTVTVRRVEGGYETSSGKGYDPKDGDLVGVVGFTGEFRYAEELPHYSDGELVDY